MDVDNPPQSDSVEPLNSSFPLDDFPTSNSSDPSSDDPLPPDVAAPPPSPDDALQELYDHQQMQDDPEHSFDRICDHTFIQGSLVLTVKYNTELSDPFTTCSLYTRTCS